MSEPEDLEDAPRAFFEATAGLVGAPGRAGESQGFEVPDDIPADGYFEDMLSEVMQLDREARWGCEAIEMTTLPHRVRTEPVLRDPRPVRVRIHGKTYHLHRVVHGQVLGCSLADAQPGTILPPTIHTPGKTLIGV